ncbi:MAG TPA: lysophospholipid acyltransferase family protein [Cyclobacteriaceae bacterium]|nr:lysophospholipid acyltransferase family protein [Cyclobacteriaceae bacterium]
MLSALSRLILKIFGWKLEGAYPHHLKKSLVIVAPHTSNWDFIVGVLFRSALKVKAYYLGKAELFKPPFGFIFRWLGGYPVNRSTSQNMVDEVVQLFNSKETFSIALSPEGTRKRVDKLRTGFYYIAKQAKVPIVMAALDFENKKAIFAEPFFTTDNQEADFEHILKFFRPIKGKRPELGLSHL